MKTMSYSCNKFITHSQEGIHSSISPLLWRCWWVSSHLNRLKLYLNHSLYVCFVSNEGEWNSAAESWWSSKKCGTKQRASPLDSQYTSRQAFENSQHLVQKLVCMHMMAVITTSVLLDTCNSKYKCSAEWWAPMRARRDNMICVFF